MNSSTVRKIVSTLGILLEKDGTRSGVRISVLSGNVNLLFSANLLIRFSYGPDKSRILRTEASCLPHSCKPTPKATRCPRNRKIRLPCSKSKMERQPLLYHPIAPREGDSRFREMRANSH